MKYLLLMLLLLPVATYSQNQEGTVLIYNVAFGGITSGVGAVINKPKGLNWRKAFVKGALQGSLGGIFNYSGKKTLYLINRNENVAFAWPAKLLHAAGTSIIENAALGEPFLQNWHIDYGLVRFDFSTNGKKKLRARFLPSSLPSIYWASQSTKFDLSTTLLTGNIAFASKNTFINISGKDFLGVSYGRAFAYVDHFTNNKYQTIAHELVHQFQFNEIQVLNAWLKPFEPKVKSKALQKIFADYIYFDIPYRWGLNLNYYEFEAERFSTNRDVRK